MYSNDLLITNKSVRGRETRHGQYNFVCPKFRHITEAGRSLSVSSIRLWNSLPDNIKRKNSLSSFKNALIPYFIACANSRFSSLLAAWDVSRGGTSATQRQKFHTNGVNQCLHHKSRSHGFPNANLFNLYVTFLLVDFGKCCVHLRTSSSKTQMLLLEKNIFHKYCLFCYRFIVAFCLSFVNNE